jgi:hypothetical protein
MEDYFIIVLRNDLAKWMHIASDPHSREQGVGGDSGNRGAIGFPCPQHDNEK